MKTSTAAWAILNPLEWRVWVDQNGSSCQNLDCRTNNQPQPSKCSWWVLTDRLTEYVFVIQSINWHKWRSVFFCMPQLAATDDRDYYRMKDRYSSSGSSNSIKDSWRVQFDVECFFGLEVHQGWNLFGSHAWPGLHQHSQSVSVLSLGNLCHSEQWHPLWPWWTHSSALSSGHHTPSPIPHHNQTPPEDLHWANRRSHQKRRKGCNVRLIQKTKSNVCLGFLRDRSSWPGMIQSRCHSVCSAKWTTSAVLTLVTPWTLLLVAQCAGVTMRHTTRWSQSRQNVKFDFFGWNKTHAVLR